MPDSKEPWNNWFHVSGSTYGQWLRGDPRGWRARHHREHSVGDYKSPPPPRTDAEKFRRSQKLMKRERVKLSPTEREVVCREFGHVLQRYEAEFIDLCVSAKHFHALVRVSPLGQRADWKKVRWIVGRAKGASARLLSKEGIRALGGIWGKRCKTKPVGDRAHQLNVAKYIPDHKKKGAVVWSILKQLDRARPPSSSSHD